MPLREPYIFAPRITPSPLVHGDQPIQPADAFTWYFQSHVAGNADHLAASPSTYITNLDKTLNANNNLYYLPTHTKLFVVMPVSSSEYHTIYATLKLYISQSQAALKRTQFVLIVTQEAANATIKAESDKTFKEIARAKKNFPELQISLLSISWPKKFAAKRAGGLYSASLKIATDTCMRAAQKAGIDPLIITNDANARAISKSYLLHYMRAMHNNPTADVFLGKIHWDIAKMRAMPGYGFVATVLMAAQDRLRESSLTVPLDSWAANSGYRASALAAIGGVDGNIGVSGSKQGFGADIDLGRRFFNARRSNKHFCMVHEAWVDSYGDRLVRQYLCNKSLTQAWHECDNNASINTLGLFATITENIVSDFDHITQRIEQMLSFMFSDLGWACFDDEAIITAALNTLLLGKPDSHASNPPLWSINGSRGTRKFAFTAEGTRRLQEVLPHLGSLIQESLSTMDDAFYTKLRSDTSFLSTLPSATQKRRIGLQALTHE